MQPPRDSISISYTRTRRGFPRPVDLVEALRALQLDLEELGDSGVADPLRPALSEPAAGPDERSYAVDSALT